MKLYALFLILAGAITSGGCATSLVRTAPPLPDNAIPPVIAVTSFDNKSNYAGQWKLGTGMADLLVSELVQSRNFTVVERSQLSSITGELKRQTEPLFREEGKVGHGRLKNAQYLIRGTINDFSQVSGGSFWVALRSFLFLGKGYKARVALTLTIIDVESGAVVDAVQSTGNARAARADVQTRYKDVAFGGDAFFKTPVGVATVSAIRRGIRGLVQKVPRVYWRPMIADVDGSGNIIITGGRNHGIQIGGVYFVRGQGKEITDPVTGDVISVLAGKQLGRIEITAVYDRVSYAKPLSGNTFNRGQFLIADEEH